MTNDVIMSFNLLDESGNQLTDVSQFGPTIVICLTLGQMTGHCVYEDAVVTLEGGIKRKIHEVRLEDRILGPDGVAVVRAINHAQDRTLLMFRINDMPLLISGDHPVKTTTGWKVIAAADKDPSKLRVGDILVTNTGEVAVTHIEPALGATLKDTYNLAVDGEKALFIDGIAVKPFKELLMKY